mgnify:FL=1
MKPNLYPDAVATAVPVTGDGSSSAHTVYGSPIDAMEAGQHPQVCAQPLANSSAIAAFQVQVPDGHGPGAEFEFDLSDGRTHRMIIPEGAHAGQVLTAITVPPGVRAGEEVVVSTFAGDMAVTIPAGMAPGSLLVIDVGEGDLRQWVDEDDGGSWTDGLRRKRRVVCGILCLSFLLLTAIITMMTPRHHQPYGHGYGSEAYTVHALSY